MRRNDFPDIRVDRFSEMESIVMKIAVQTGGLADSWSFDGKTAFRMIREAGFEAIDWNLDNDCWKKEQIINGTYKGCIFDKSLDEITAHYAGVIDAVRENGLEITQAHAAFPLYVKGHPEFDEYGIGVLGQTILLCDRVGCRNLVVHGISLMLDDDTQTAETVREKNIRLYESLIPVLKQTDVTVCLENLFSTYRGHIIEGICSDPNEAVWYIDYLNEKAGKKCFGFCLDTGHLNVLGKDPDKFIKILGGRIRALHLHDNSGVKDEHLAPYFSGNINWGRVTSGLRAVGYRGDLSFETFAAVKPDRLDREMLPVVLHAICETGKTFREKILAEQLF